MSDWRDFPEQARRSPANVRFRDLCHFVERLGFVLDRTKGSHRIYRHATRRDLPTINVQEGRAGKAKPYQVKQVLGLVESFGLEIRK